MTDSPNHVAFRVGRAAFFFHNPDDVKLARNCFREENREAFDLGYEQEAEKLAYELEYEKGL